MGIITPGPIELIIIMVVTIALIAHIILTRAVFRINTQIKLLTEIRDELKQLNARDKGGGL